VGVAPLLSVKRLGHGPAVVRSLEFLGADPYVTEVRGPLVDPAHEGAVFRTLRAELLRCRGDWDWIGWRGVPAAGPGARLLGEAGVALPQQVIGYTLPLEGDWESFRQSRPRNLRESLRKCYNSLRRDGHTFALDVARTPAEVRAGLGRFLELHRLRAEADGLRAHGNVFADPASRGFLFDVCDRLARRDAVRVFLLRVGDTHATARVAFALGDTLYLYFSGYDPAWARYSVMTTTVAEAVRHAFAHGFRTVHLSTGTDESKLRWRPEATTWLDGVEDAPGPRAATARWLSRRLSAAPGSASPVQRVARALLGRRRQA
jgi:CelD/BcsL family acetyltransferase involved in cellulose biosynthesis